MELHEGEGKATPRTMLGRRLRRMRESADLSLRALADQVGYPHTYLSRVEHGDQLPSSALAAALDRHFGTNALFRDLLELAQEATIPDYGRTVGDREAEAIRIQVFSSSLIPSLLQTDDYTHAFLRDNIPAAPDEAISALIARRKQRKSLLEAEDPPLYWAIADEAALKRPIGGLECMRDQLRHLKEFLGRPHMTFQVIPFGEGAYAMMGGSLTLLTLQNGADIAYIESFASGETVELPRRILDLTQRFDLARSKALSEDGSLELVDAYLKEYENGTEP